MTLDLISISELNSQNVKATSKRFPIEADYINRLIHLYTQFPSALGLAISEDKLVEYQLFWITLRGLFCSSELIFSAHVAESYMVTSRSLEAAGYANHIRKSPQKARVWIRKKKNDALFKKTFSPKWNGSETDKIKSAYNLTREYGVHSNFASTIFHQTNKDDKHKQNVYTDIGNLKDLHRSLVYTLNCYIDILEIMELSFQELLNNRWKQKFLEFRAIFSDRLIQLKDYFTDHSDLENTC